MPQPVLGCIPFHRSVRQIDHELILLKNLQKVESEFCFRKMRSWMFQNPENPTLDFVSGKRAPRGSRVLAYSLLISLI